MKRIQTNCELEFVWSCGLLERERYQADSGYWSKNKNEISQSSLQAGEITKELRDHVKTLAFQGFAVVAMQELKLIWISKSCETSPNKYSKSVWYAEIFFEEKIFSKIFERESSLLADLDIWASGVRAFMALPRSKPFLDVRQILFSPEVVGCLLHELIGHAAEEVDLKNSSINGVNFDVYDWQGEVGMWGYTPFGDDGTSGRPVKIFDSSLARILPLGTASGNLRAVDWRWHPIVRQRCLRIESKSELSIAPAENRVLVMDEIEMGSSFVEESRAELRIRRSRYIDEKSCQWQLPDLNLKITRDVLSILQFHGQEQVCSPAAGCHKGLQRGLSVSFKVPWAFVDAEDAFQLGFEYSVDE